MKVLYQSAHYAPDLVTGVYVRVQGKFPEYTFKVYETATCWQKGTFYGKPGHGYTLREYETDGHEFPEEFLAECIRTKTTMRFS